MIHNDGSEVANKMFGLKGAGRETATLQGLPIEIVVVIAISTPFIVFVPIRVSVAVPSAAAAAAAATASGASVASAVRHGVTLVFVAR